MRKTKANDLGAHAARVRTSASLRFNQGVPSPPPHASRMRSQVLRSCFCLLLLCLALFAQTPQSTEKPELILQTGHAQKSEAISFSPNGRYVATGSIDRSIKIWEAATGHELRALNGSNTVIKALAFSPNGQLLAASGADGKLRLWDVTTGEEKAVLPGHTKAVSALAFSRDGRWLASGGTDDYTIKIWEVAAQREVRSLSGSRAWVTALAFSPNAQTLVAGGADGTLKFWDTSAWREERTLNAHRERVRGLVYSANSERLATCGNDGVTHWWDARANQPLKSFTNQTTPIIAVALAANDTQLLICAADHTIKRFNLANGNELATLSVSENLNRYETAAFSPMGEWLAACDGSRNVVVRDATKQADAIPLESQVNAVKAVAFSPDGRWFATGNQDTSLTLWETYSGRVVAVLFGNTGSITSLAFTPDSQLLATGSFGDEIKLWDVSSARVVKSWPASSNGVNGLVFTPDGQRIFSAGVDGTIKGWEVATGRQLATLTGHQRDVNALSLSSDGKWLVSAGADQTVRLWETAAGRPARVFNHTGMLYAVTFSPNNRMVAAGGVAPNVKVWDVASGNEVRSFSNSTAGNQRSPRVLSLAFAPDNNLLAVGNDNNEILLWDSATGNARATLIGHAGAVNALQFNSDGQWLASGGEDGSARFWQTATGTLAATIAGLHGGNDWIVATPDGLFDGSPSSWHQILWRFARDTFNVAPVELFFNEYFYPELLADVLAGKRPPAKEQISMRDRRQPNIKLSVVESAGVTSSIATNRTAKIRLEVAEAAPDRQHSRGSGAQDMRLFRNGALVKVWHGDVLKGQAKTALECDVTMVAGDNRLTAYAFNRDNIKSADAERHLIGASSLQRRGTAYVLAVGLNQYSNPNFNLKFAVDDAKDFSAEWLKQQTALNRFVRIEPVLLLDQQATKANLVAALKRLTGNTSEALPAGAPPELQRLQRAQPEDAVVVYFAGHGVALESRFYLLPFELGYKGKREELTEAALKQVFPLAVSDQELESLFEPLDAGNILLVIDACNSGGALDSEENRRGPMNTKGLAQLAYEKGMHVLTASQTYQVAQEASALGHGYLTYALIEDGLKKLAADLRPRDGQVLLREWFDYASQAVPQMQEAKVRGERLLLKQKMQKIREVQRPRVFYRREAEAQPLVVGRK